MNPQVPGKKRKWKGIEGEIEDVTALGRLTEIKRGTKKLGLEEKVGENEGSSRVKVRGRPSCLFACSYLKL